MCLRLNSIMLSRSSTNNKQAYYHMHGSLRCISSTTQQETVTRSGPVTSRAVLRTTIKLIPPIAACKPGYVYTAGRRPLPVYTAGRRPLPVYPGGLRPPPVYPGGLRPLPVYPGGLQPLPAPMFQLLWR